MNIYQQISEIVSAHIHSMPVHLQGPVHQALASLLGDNFFRYNFTNLYCCNNFNAELNALYNINEKTEKRKNKGVYYTPEDVCRYIVWNSMLMMLDPESERIYSETDALKRIAVSPESETADLLIHKTFFDPTCGSGEFLLNVFRAKYAVLRKYRDCTDDAIYAISKTIYGNDIDSRSTDISKIRLFFEICRHIQSAEMYMPIAMALRDRFSNIDYVVYEGQFDCFFDCIVGNPPYVEYSKYEGRKSLRNNYGNIYADVIQNSVASLKEEGTFGFIIPLSYISTSRMAAIRDYVRENTDTQFIMSFADRPDCLFQKVHQKLNIVIARKARREHKLYTSNYRHWYKEERRILLNGCALKENHAAERSFIPKLGNSIEESIYKKVLTFTNDNIFDRQSETGRTLFLNMRGCFWIKAFSFNPGSKEYKVFKYGSAYPFLHCVLNSSLFWLYWTIVSDGWHITTKELKGFFVPALTDEEYRMFEPLSADLETRLEKTKKYIGSKQTEYEYKHKECKGEVDRIDDFLAGIYGLTGEELAYIKNYALKYRMGSGADDKDD